MNIFPPDLLAEWASNSYRCYILTAVGQDAHPGFYVARFSRFVAVLLADELGREPTVSERNQRERQIIEAVESDYPNQPLPPRPHGL